MANEINIYTPRYLAEVVRTAPPIHTFFRDRFFTNIKAFVTKRVDIDIVKGDRRMAAFVHPAAGGAELSEKGYRTESYAAPLVNPSDITTADMFLDRLPGETLYSGMTPAQRAAQKLIDEYNRLNDAVTRREEWMCAQAILTGKIPVKGKGVDEVIDYGFTNKKEKTGTARWGQSAADPLKDLDEWTDEVLVNGFSNVDMCIMGKNALKAFVNDEKVQKFLDNRRYFWGEIAPRDLPNGVKYYGHLNAPSLDIYSYSEVYYDDWTDPDSPETKPLMPDNMVVLIPSNTNFMMAYGACTYLDGTGAWVTSQAARTFTSFIKHQPDRRFVEIQSRPLPIPDKIDSWLVGTVM